MVASRAKSVSASEARTHWASILKKVEQGKEIVITKRGRPIARLLPTLVPRKWDKSVFDKIRAFRGRIALPKGETAKDLINAGRRI